MPRSVTAKSAQQEEDYIHMGKGAVALQDLFKAHAFDHQKDEEEQAPKYKIPAGAMPEAGGCPHHKEVEIEPGLADAVAAQGNIQILPEPGA